MATDSVRIETISNWDKLSLSDGVTTVLGNKLYVFFIFIVTILSALYSKVHVKCRYSKKKK